MDSLWLRTTVRPKWLDATDRLTERLGNEVALQAAIQEVEEKLFIEEVVVYNEHGTGVISCQTTPLTIW